MGHLVYQFAIHIFLLKFHTELVRFFTTFLFFVVAVVSIVAVHSLQLVCIAYLWYLSIVHWKTAWKDTVKLYHSVHEYAPYTAYLIRLWELNIANYVRIWIVLQKDYELLHQICFCIYLSGEWILVDNVDVVDHSC